MKPAEPLSAAGEGAGTRAGGGGRDTAEEQKPVQAQRGRPNGGEGGGGEEEKGSRERGGEDFYGKNLFNPDRSPTPMLEALLTGVADYIVRASLLYRPSTISWTFFGLFC